MKRGMEIRSAEAGPWLCEGRFESAEVSNARDSAGTLQDRAVKYDDFPERQVAHQARRLYRSRFLS